MARTTTIAALATAPGKGAIAVIRVSGPASLKVLKDIFADSKEFKPHYMHLGWVHDGDEKIDQVMAVSMPGPNSYTGEDSVEIQSHGSPAVVERILRLLFEHGVVPAEPGEFSKRAFLNGKLDLTQAEAVMQLVNSEHGHLSRLATRQLAGEFSQQINNIKMSLIELIAELSADLDFSEEDLGGLSDQQISTKLKTILDSLNTLSAQDTEVKLMEQSLEVALIGLPNAGKSTLLNALLGYERALVSHQAGTTRDSVSEVIELEGIPLKLIDTAGLNKAATGVEEEGMKRSLQHLGSADLVLLLVEPRQGGATLDYLNKLDVFSQLKPNNTLVVKTKCDLGNVELPKDLAPFTAVEVSSTTKKGLTKLHKQLLDKLKLQESTQSAQVITKRQNDLLNRAVAGLKELTQTKLPSRDALVVELGSVLAHLNELSGEQVSQQVIDSIFANFCIGK